MKSAFGVAFDSQHESVIFRNVVNVSIKIEAVMFTHSTENSFAAQLKLQLHVGD